MTISPMSSWSRPPVAAVTVRKSDLKGSGLNPNPTSLSSNKSKTNEAFVSHCYSRWFVYADDLSTIISCPVPIRLCTFVCYCLSHGPMKFTRTKPCGDCPFLRTNAPSYGADRLNKFADTYVFPCHKTAELVEGKYKATKDSVACAGMLIYLEKRHAPNQMMQVAERFGLYDKLLLDMNSTVA